MGEDLASWIKVRGLLNNHANRARIANVLELYANGMQMPEISEITGVSRMAVSNYLTKYWFAKRDGEIIKLKSNA